MFDDLTPIKKGLILMVVLLILAMGFFTQKYLPYNEYIKIESKCTVETGGTVVQSGEPIVDGVFFYGPMVEYTAGDRLIRAYAVNTVAPEKTHQVGDRVTVLFNPSMPSDVIVAEDDDIRTQYDHAVILSGVLCGAAMLSLILGFALTDRGPKIKTFFINKDGNTFEQWQKMQQQKDAAEKGNSEPEETPRES